MRTTLDLADDILLAEREKARREKRSLDEVLSELAREALAGGRRGEAAAEVRRFRDFEPFPPRGPAISNNLVDELREEEAE